MHNLLSNVTQFVVVSCDQTRSVCRHLAADFYKNFTARLLGTLHEIVSKSNDNEKLTRRELMHAKVATCIKL